MTEQVSTHETELVAVADLKPHPRNYRVHHPDQLEHIVHSLREHGVYRNVVVARDYTILAGHGVVEAAQKIEMEKLPVIRLDVDPDDPRAIRVLVGDNEISGLAEVDDRLLSEHLRVLREAEETGLLGTGYDDLMLANLVFVTRPASEIADLGAAADWIGLPEFERADQPVQASVLFDSVEDRAAMMEKLGVTTVSRSHGNGKILSFWWPPRDRADVESIKFVGGEPTETS